MNEQRNPLRQKINAPYQVPLGELEARYNQVLEARDDDWKRWREREKELLAGIPQVVKPVRKSTYELFSERMGKLAPAIAPVIAIIYAWWNATAYPPPGEKFWTDEQVQPFFQSALLAAFTLMMFNRLLAVTVIAMVGCLIFAYLFKG